MLKLVIARCLEEGAFGSWPGRCAARLWRRASSPVRPVTLPAGACVVGIGGATLGGAGKTPVTLQLARMLSQGDAGESIRRPSGSAAVAVVAHGYQANVRKARLVCSTDSVQRVGDEALMLVRALGEHRVPVVVGACRTDCIALGASLAPVVLVDGMLQTRPAPLGCAVLVLDAAAPWGSGRCPPAGDLRARRERLLSAADVLLVCSDPAELSCHHPVVPGIVRPVYFARSELTGARAQDGARYSLAQLRGMRLGLVLAIARPERVRRALAVRGVFPSTVNYYADHSVPRPSKGPGTSGPAVDAWLTTGKCSVKLGQTYAGAPVWVLEHTVRLPAPFVRHVRDILSLGAEPW